MTTRETHANDVNFISSRQAFAARAASREALRPVALVMEIREEEPGPRELNHSHRHLSAFVCGFRGISNK